MKMPIALLMLFAVFCCPAEQKLKGLISNWLICGPFPSYLKNGTDSGPRTDHIPGGEESVNPYPGLGYDVIFKADMFDMVGNLGMTNEWGFNVNKKVRAVWTQRHFKDPAQCIVDSFFKPFNDHFVFYAAVYVHSPITRKVLIKTGSDDDNQVFLNHVKIGESLTCQAVHPDTFSYPGILKRGMNLLVIKVTDRLHDAAFCARITGDKGEILPDLVFYTDNPARKMHANTFHNGFAGLFSFAEPLLFDNEKGHLLTFRFYAPDPAPAYQVRLAGRTCTLHSGDTWEIMLPAEAGEKLLTAEISENGKKLAFLDYGYTVHSKENLIAEEKYLQKRLGEAKTRMHELENAVAAAKKSVKLAHEKLRKAQKTKEAQYAMIHAAAAAKGTPSFPEPFIPDPAVSRSRMMLNGIWNSFRKPIRLPMEMRNSYYLFHFYPVERCKKGEVPDNWKKADGYTACRQNWKPLPGYEGFVPDLRQILDSVTFERTFEDDGNQNRPPVFFCSNIVGRIELYCNGMHCGSYSGLAGIVEIPLKNVKKGKNTIRIDYHSPGPIYPDLVCTQGVVGDIWIEKRAIIHIADVWVKPSWRKSQLSTVTEVMNPGAPRTYQLMQYAVRDGKILFRLPVQKGKLAAGLNTLRVSGLWRDPALWSLEQPILHTMVSDLYIDGKLTDRKTDQFGFREFWTHGTDYYLNGKRVVIQGDVGCTEWAYAKRRDIMFPLLREDGINAVRMHDSNAPGQVEIARECDRRGMFYLAQLYPAGTFDRKDSAAVCKNIRTLEEWKNSPMHTESANNYIRWFRALRNSPSVITWSLDNELVTSGCLSRGIERRNELIDRIMELYAKLLRNLDPEIILTRDGDLCTYNSDYAHFDPAMLGNVHYPDYKLERFVNNWQDFFEYRPVLWGETLYCSYVWGGWPGPTPLKVAEKTERVGRIAKLYNDLDVPGVVYMGLSLDGFVAFKPDGSGSPWGVIETPHGKNRPQNFLNGKMKPGEYPFYPVKYPAAASFGLQPQFQQNAIWGFGFHAVNWSAPHLPTHVRNTINDAYRKALPRQPSLAPIREGEIVIKTSPLTDIWTMLPDGSKLGMRTDMNGKAWFTLPSAGWYLFSSGTKKQIIDVPCREIYARSPGFDKITEKTLE